MIRAITYNIFIGRKLDDIIEWLIKNQDRVDLFCFQEFPQDRIKEVVEKLKDFSIDYAFAGGITIQGSIYGELTLYNKKKLIMVASERIYLGGRGDLLWFLFDRYGKLDLTFSRNEIERSALLTTFTYNQKTLSVINTHLTSTSLNFKRLSQLKKILQVVPHNPTIILGDFNYPFGKLVSFMEKHRFTHATKHISTHRLLKVIPQHLDYIFYKGCQVSGVAVHKVPYSDHFPIVFTINL